MVMMYIKCHTTQSEILWKRTNQKQVEQDTEKLDEGGGEGGLTVSH